MSDDDFDLGGEGGRSFRFEHIGATVRGKIISQSKQQARDFDTGELASWPDGNPKWQYVITLQTELRDNPDDDGIRAVYLQGSLKPESRSNLSAVREAARKAVGSYKTQIGGMLTLTYVADGQRSRPQFNPPKQYEAQYEPPEMSFDDEPQSSNGSTLTATSPSQASGSVQPLAPAPTQNSVPDLIGWLNGKPIDSALLAAFANTGTDVRTLPGFQPAP